MSQRIRIGGAIACILLGTVFLAVFNIRLVPALFSTDASEQHRKIQTIESSAVESTAVIKELEVAYLPGAIDLEQDQKALVLYALSDYISDTLLRISIEAHANRTENTMEDLSLSMNRAQSLGSFITENGIKPENVVAKGFGSLHADQNGYNNRVSIKLYRGIP